MSFDKWFPHRPLKRPPIPGSKRKMKFPKCKECGKQKYLNSDGLCTQCAGGPERPMLENNTNRVAPTEDDADRFKRTR